MSLNDPTLRKNEEPKPLKLGFLIPFWIFIAATTGAGAYLLLRTIEQDGVITEGQAALQMTVAYIVFGVGFVAFILMSIALAPIQGGLTSGMIAIMLGVGIGMHFGSNGQIPAVVFIVMAAIAALMVFAVIRRRIKDARRANLTHSLTRSFAVMHDQNYTDSSFDDASGVLGNVVLTFKDSWGRDRFVTRKLTQYKARPIPNGTPVTMYWEPREPENLDKIIFAREYAGRTEYF